MTPFDLGDGDETRSSTPRDLTGFSTRSGVTTAGSTSSATSTRPGTQTPNQPLSPRSALRFGTRFPGVRIQRMPLDATGWLTYFNNQRHSGGPHSPTESNVWEEFLNSEPPLDETPATRDRSRPRNPYPDTAPPTPVWARRENSLTDARRFSSPNYHSSAYHTFNAQSPEVRGVGPASGDNLNAAFGRASEAMEHSMNDLNHFHYQRTDQESQGTEYGESEAQLFNHPCVHHGHSHLHHIDSAYDADHNSTPLTAYAESDDEDAEEEVRIQFVVRPTNPVRNYSAESN
jgi:hypothetical protein